MANVRWTVVALLFFAVTIDDAVPFAIAAATYSLALLLIHLRLSRLEPITLEA